MTSYVSCITLNVYREVEGSWNTFGARAIHSFHPPGSLSSLDSKLRHSDFTLLIYRVGSMRLDRFNVWGSGHSGHVSGSERRGQRGSLLGSLHVAEQIPASSCTSTEQQQQRQGDAEQQHHSSSSRHHLLSRSILETPRSLCRQRGRHVHQASSQQSTS